VQVCYLADELRDLQWEKIKDFLPGRKEHVGRTAADNRLFVNGVLWVLRSGARWADLPERYGKYKSVHKRFVRWANSGVWERVFQQSVHDKKNQCLMLDSTIVRAHQQPATGRKNAAWTRLWGVPEEVSRAARQGIFEKRFLPLFGYFPWKCRACDKRLLLRSRRRPTTVSFE
jgi:transposase